MRPWLYKAKEMKGWGMMCANNDVETFRWLVLGPIFHPEVNIKLNLYRAWGMD